MTKKMRVHELAKELNIENNKLILEFLSNSGIAKTSSSNLEEDQIQLVRQHFEKILKDSNNTEMVSEKTRTPKKTEKPKTTKELENKASVDKVENKEVTPKVTKDTNLSKVPSKTTRESDNIQVKSKKKIDAAVEEVKVVEKNETVTFENNISLEVITNDEEIKNEKAIVESPKLELEPKTSISSKIKDKILVKIEFLKNKINTKISQKEKVVLKDSSSLEVHQVRKSKIREKFESYVMPKIELGTKEEILEPQKKKLKELGIVETKDNKEKTGYDQPSGTSSHQFTEKRKDDKVFEEKKDDKKPAEKTQERITDTDRSKKNNKSKKDKSDYKKKQEQEEENRLLSKTLAKKKKKEDRKQDEVEEELSKEIEIFDGMNVKDLADKLRVKETDIIRELFMKGMMVTVNQSLEQDLIAKIVIEKGFTIKEAQSKDDEMIERKLDEMSQDESLLETRPPVVTIMGHVDHGKTSLLDAIRKTKVAESEAGGITQHIGAYQVTLNNRLITFLDTPGHEAFTAMRARGARSTDIAVLVVAADDGIMPQTIEAINHAKAAAVPIIVAINKIDKADANPERVKQQLAEHNLVPEDWGGSTVMVEVSARMKKNLDELLEMIILTADLQDLKANPNKAAQGIIIESKLDKGKGPVATVLVQSGTLKVGDNFYVGMVSGKIRAMFNYLGHPVKLAMPSTPVQIIGCSSVPTAGELFKVVGNEKEARDLAEQAQFAEKEKSLSSVRTFSLESLSEQIVEGKIKELNLVIKTDVQGSLEALEQSLSKLAIEEVKLRIIHSAVGDTTEYDVSLAVASKAIIIAFNVKTDAKTKEIAEKEKVDIRNYNIIYRVIEDIQLALEGLLEPEYEDVLSGKATVRNIFTIGKTNVIAGCYVTEGKIPRNSIIKLYRDSKLIHTGKLSSLKRFKDDVKEVATGFECGMALEKFNDIKENDVFESFVTQVKQIGRASCRERV